MIKIMCACTCTFLSILLINLYEQQTDAPKTNFCNL